MKEAGLMQREPGTLEEAQYKARVYANEAADNLEAVRDSGVTDTRELLRANWHAAEAFGKLNDAGVSSQTMGDVTEAADARNFAERG